MQKLSSSLFFFNFVLLQGDGVKAHELKDKGRLSTQTNCAVYRYLNSVGVKTHYVGEDANNPNAFVAYECAMIPIEWVSR